MMLTQENRKPWSVLMHLAAWGILFGLPLFFNGRESHPMTLYNYMRSIIVPFSFVCVFYINYFFLVKHYLFVKNTGRFLLANVVMFVGAIVVVHFMMEWFPDLEQGADHHGPRPDFRMEMLFFFSIVVSYALVAGLSVAIKMTAGWFEAEAACSEAELQNLKSQLNPHFLFNTLNNIYSLIAFSPERAQEAVHDLSRLLRYVLYDSSQPLVPLEKELDFIRNYVELMRIRLPEYVELKSDIFIPESGMRIAPLLFISLIENAFKHGVSNSQPSFIHIRISGDRGRVSCEILNSCFPKDATKDRSGSGIGLVNLKKRLALLYPEQALFRYGQEEGNYHSLLTITFNTPDE